GKKSDDWDNSWTQSIYTDQFKKQVDWELSGLEKADTVIFYFAKNTKSPITLMELGLICGLANKKEKNIVVYCDPDFWRRGNIEIMCERYSLAFYTDKAEFLSYVKDNI
ncbi:nucleoside 2-deoxyribosyltransferase domain-containing protein, partial [Candidatus Microgenomates bacterium]|nr:nucleoside 2-deoxyribosyltransferase domain-containing protein [Candidatus Microgenomates bacterium]